MNKPQNQLGVRAGKRRSDQQNVKLFVETQYVPSVTPTLACSTTKASAILLRPRNSNCLPKSSAITLAHREDSTRLTSYTNETNKLLLTRASRIIETAKRKNATILPPEPTVGKKQQQRGNSVHTRASLSVLVPPPKERDKENVDTINIGGHPRGSECPTKAQHGDRGKLFDSIKGSVSVPKVQVQILKSRLQFLATRESRDAKAHLDWHRTVDPEERPMKVAEMFCVKRHSPRRRQAWAKPFGSNTSELQLKLAALKERLRKVLTAFPQCVGVLRTQIAELRAGKGHQ